MTLAHRYRHGLMPLHRRPLLLCTLRSAAVPCATPSNVSSCAIGDLSGKWGDLVSTNSATTMSVSAVDPTLNLAGASSVLGRSVVVRPILFCFRGDTCLRDTHALKLHRLGI